MPTFDELDKNAKEKAIERWREEGHCWSDPEQQMFSENAVQYLNERGYLVETGKTYWSLYPKRFGFEGEIDVEAWRKHKDHKKYLKWELKPRWKTIPPPWYQWSPFPKVVALLNFFKVKDVQIFTPLLKITGRNLDMDVETDIKYTGDEMHVADYVGALIPDFDQILKLAAEDHAAVLAGMLEDEYEYACGDDNIADALIANEYEFDEEGVLQ